MAVAKAVVMSIAARAQASSVATSALLLFSSKIQLQLDGHQARACADRGGLFMYCATPRRGQKGCVTDPLDNSGSRSRGLSERAPR